MKKKLLLLSIAAILATPTTFAAYSIGSATDGTDADDKQTLTVKVPEVALLNISDANVDLNESTLTAPTTAGSGFTGSATGSATYNISSNIANPLVATTYAASTTRKITVAVDSAVGKVPEGGQLEVTVAAPTGATAGIATLRNTTAAAQDSATSIGNVAGTGVAITYALKADTTGTGMIAHTASNGTLDDNIGLIYTLTDD